MPFIAPAPRRGAGWDNMQANAQAAQMLAGAFQQVQEQNRRQQEAAALSTILQAETPQAGLAQLSQGRQGQGFLSRINPFRYQGPTQTELGTQQQLLGQMMVDPRQREYETLRNQRLGQDIDQNAQSFPLQKTSLELRNRQMGQNIDQSGQIFPIQRDAAIQDIEHSAAREARDAEKNDYDRSRRAANERMDDAQIQKVETSNRQLQQQINMDYINIGNALRGGADPQITFPSLVNLHGNLVRAMNGISAKFEKEEGDAEVYAGLKAQLDSVNQTIQSIMTRSSQPQQQGPGLLSSIGSSIMNRFSGGQQAESPQADRTDYTQYGKPQMVQQGNQSMNASNARARGLQADGYYHAKTRQDAQRLVEMGIDPSKIAMD